MKVLIIGATGDVGQGLVFAAAERGWQVAAAGRHADTVQAIASQYPAGQVVPVTGSLNDPAAAGALLAAAHAALGGLDAVVVSVNGPKETRVLLEWKPGALLKTLEANVISHFNALGAALKVLGPQGVFIGIGGGMADFIVAKNGHVAIAQAALRNLYRSAAKENRGSLIRELQVAAMVDGASTRAIADDTWLKAEQIGRHACAMIERPAEFPGPVVTLSRNDPIGVPPPAKR